MNIFTALREIGVEATPRGGPQQIRCPIHKGGQETSPSARIYEDTDSIYCFTCHKSWDGVALIAEARGIEYREAAVQMRAKFGGFAPSRRSKSLAAALRETVDAVRASGRSELIDPMLTDLLEPYAAGASVESVEQANDRFRRMHFRRIA